MDQYTVHCSSRIDTTHLNPIARRAAQLRAEGVALHSLNDSNPTHHGLAPRTVPEVYAADPRGSMQSRQQLAGVLGRQQSRIVHPEQLYVLDSTSQGYAWIITALCDIGDAVLAPAPGYPLIESICQLQGAQCIHYHLLYDGSWFVDIAELRQLCEQNTHIRALVVVNPNNPTSSYIHVSDYKAIIDLCRHYDLALIADEVFFDFALHGDSGNCSEDYSEDQYDIPRRFAGESQVVTFALDGLSKRLAAPHAKVGWIEVSGPQHEVRKVMRTLDSIADDYLPYSVLTERALPQLLEDMECHHRTIIQRIQHNFVQLKQLLAQHESGLVSLVHAEAGWNVLLRFPASIDENELGVVMLDRYHTSIQPGYYFDMASSGFVAVSLLPEPEQFACGVRNLLQAVDGIAGNV